MWVFIDSPIFLKNYADVFIIVSSATALQKKHTKEGLDGKEKKIQ